MFLHADYWQFRLSKQKPCGHGQMESTLGFTPRMTVKSRVQIPEARTQVDRPSRGSSRKDKLVAALSFLGTVKENSDGQEISAAPLSRSWFTEKWQAKIPSTQLLYRFGDYTFTLPFNQKGATMEMRVHLIAHLGVYIISLLSFPSTRSFDLNVMTINALEAIDSFVERYVVNAKNALYWCEIDLIVVYVQYNSRDPGSVWDDWKKEDPRSELQQLARRDLANSDRLIWLLRCMLIIFLLWPKWPLSVEVALSSNH